jgi:hypothetical protein
MYISWLHLCLGDKGSASNDSPYLMAALVEPLLQSSHPICGISVTLCSEPKPQKGDGGLGHSSNNDMHLICLSRNKELNQ